MICENLSVTERTYKMRIGDRMVEVAQDETGWLVSTGDIFARSWQSVWCPDTKTLLEVQELIAKTKRYGDLAVKNPIPQGCELREYLG